MSTSLCLLLVAALWTHRASTAGAGDQAERLIGWRGEVPKSEPQHTTPTTGNVQPGNSTNEDGPRWVQVLSWKPRAFVHHNFLSRAEVKHVLKLSARQMKRSTVVGGPNNTGRVAHLRSSAGTFLRRNQDAVILAIEQRLALWTQLKGPPEHQEDMQVLRYGPTNEYRAHADSLGRAVSVLMYLVAPEEGGETAFPGSGGWVRPEMGEQLQGEFSACAKGHVAYKPKQGDALMFFDVTPDYKRDDGYSLHTGCPVLKGVKWNAVKWIQTRPFRPELWEESLKAPYKALPDPGECVDLHDDCQAWMKDGECERNPAFMLGFAEVRGVCRLACNACTPCPAGDAACLKKNREGAGYLEIDPAELGGLLDE